MPSTNESLFRLIIFVFLLSVPRTCNNETLWPILRIPGSSLLGRVIATINRLTTRQECIELCLFEKSFECRSVSFEVSQRNKISHNLLGRCLLSRDSKNTEPDSFHVAPISTEYIENNCHAPNNDKTEEDFCSYEHFPESAFVFAERQYVGLTDRQCQEICFKEREFFCKGITYESAVRTVNSRCFIHSEDIISMGPRAVVSMPNSYYLKRVECLDRM